jgi:hypothetical protein
MNNKLLIGLQIVAVVLTIVVMVLQIKELTRSREATRPAS